MRCVVYLVSKDFDDSSPLVVLPATSGSYLCLLHSIFVALRHFYHLGNMWEIYLYPFEEDSHLFLYWLQAFMVPPTMKKCSSLPKSSSAFAVISFSDCGQSVCLKIKYRVLYWVFLIVKDIEHFNKCMIWSCVSSSEDSLFSSISCLCWNSFLVFSDLVFYIFMTGILTDI